MCILVCVRIFQSNLEPWESVHLGIGHIMYKRRGLEKRQTNKQNPNRTKNLETGSDQCFSDDLDSYVSAFCLPIFFFKPRNLFVNFSEELS